jgi:Protein phosphatase inhibitor 2 (IPP-2)
MKRSSDGTRNAARVVWDEENLKANAEIQQAYAGVRIAEPKTPYHSAAPVGDSEDDDMKPLELDGGAGKCTMLMPCCCCCCLAVRDHRLRLGLYDTAGSNTEGCGRGGTMTAFEYVMHNGGADFSPPRGPDPQRSHEVSASLCLLLQYLGSCHITPCTSTSTALTCTIIMPTCKALQSCDALTCTIMPTCKALQSCDAGAVEAGVTSGGGSAEKRDKVRLVHSFPCCSHAQRYAMRPHACTLLYLMLPHPILSCICHEQPCTSFTSSGSEGSVDKRRRFEARRKQHYNMRVALQQAWM